IDRDQLALSAARARLAPFGDRAVLVHGELRDLRALAREAGFEALDGVIADGGVSSPQLDDPGRGFAFMTQGPLDMRMDRSRGETALELIGRLSDDALANVLYELGDERRSRAIAGSIRRAYAAGELET